MGHTGEHLACLFSSERSAINGDVVKGLHAISMHSCGSARRLLNTHDELHMGRDRVGGPFSSVARYGDAVRGEFFLVSSRNEALQVIRPLARNAVVLGVLDLLTTFVCAWI